MSSLTLQSENGVAAEVNLRRFSVSEYHRMIREGYFADDERYELIRGMILKKMPKNPPHSTVLNSARKAIEPQLPPGCTLRIQEPITLAESEPEPDLVVAVGTDERYADHHPAPSEILLVVEVSDSSLSLDRGAKLEEYAASGLEPYLLLNIPGRRLESFSEPFEVAYRQAKATEEGGEIEIAILSTMVRINVSDLFRSLPVRSSR